MEPEPDDKGNSGAKPRYRWPWFILAAFLLAIVLAILWMTKEVEKARRWRELNSPTRQAGA